jgi:hypothetical protein
MKKEAANGTQRERHILIEISSLRLLPERLPVADLHIGGSV